MRIERETYETHHLDLQDTFPNIEVHAQLSHPQPLMKPSKSWEMTYIISDRTNQDATLMSELNASEKLHPRKR